MSWSWNRSCQAYAPVESPTLELVHVGQKVKSETEWEPSL